MSAPTADRKYVALLALAAGLILVFGTWARPDTRRDDSPRLSSPAELMRLQRMTQRRNVQEMAAFFSEVAANASRHLTWVVDNHSTAVIWDIDGMLVTAAGKENFPAVTLVRTAEHVEVEARRAVASPLFPIVSLRVGAGDAFQPVQSVGPEVLLAGDWLVAVARAGRRKLHFRAGHLRRFLSAGLRGIQLSGDDLQRQPQRDDAGRRVVRPRRPFTWRGHSVRRPPGGHGLGRHPGGS